MIIIIKWYERRKINEWLSFNLQVLNWILQSLVFLFERENKVAGKGFSRGLLSVVHYVETFSLNIKIWVYVGIFHIYPCYCERRRKDQSGLYRNSKLNPTGYYTKTFIFKLNSLGAYAQTNCSHDCIVSLYLLFSILCMRSVETFQF